LLILEGFAGEPIHGTWDQLLLDVLAKLVVDFEALFDIGSAFVLLRWRLWWVEEVKERLAWDGLADNAGLLGV
jgi:hypothetical protein